MIKLSRQNVAYLFGFLLLGASVCFWWVDPSHLWADFILTPLRGYDDIFEGLTLRACLAAAGVYGIVMLLGYALSRFLFENSPEPKSITWLASFGLGYILSHGIIRAVAFGTRNGDIFLPSLLIILVLSLALLLCEQNPPENRRTRNRGMVFSEMTVLLLASILLTLFLVESVHKGIHDWTGHGENHYAFFLREMRESNPQKKFPIITQHYGEILFNHFLYAMKYPNGTFIARFNPVVFFWWTNALVKVSAAFLVYFLFIRLKLSRVFSAIGTLFLFLGSTSFDGKRYLILFDSFNPLYLVLHPDRVLGPIVILLFLVHVLTGDAEKTTYPLTRILFYGLFGIGLAAGPIHNFVFWIGFWMLILLLQMAKMVNGATGAGNPPRENVNSMFGKIILGLGLVCLFVPPFVVYNPRGPVPGLGLAFGMLAGLGFVIMVLGRAIRDPGFSLTTFKTSQWTKWGAVFLAGGILSLLFFGNVFVDRMAPHHVMKKILITAGQINWMPEMKYFEFFPPLLDHKKFQFFQNALTFHDKIHKPWSQYDRGGLYFLAYYGFLYLSTAWALLVLRQQPLPQTTSSLCEPENSERRFWSVMIFTSLSLFAYSFFYADFVTDMNAWFKSRFFEIPFYVILFTFCVAIGRFGSKLSRRLIGTWFIIQIILPIVSTERIQQWKLNLDFLIRHLG